MKNITFSVDEQLLEEAKEKARRENRRLNDLFRSWLEEWTGRTQRGVEYDEIMRELSDKIEAGRKFSREEMNER